MSDPHALTRADLLDRIAVRIDRIDVGHPARVAIDGPDAAGKTTLADELAEALRIRGRTVIRASADDFQRCWAQRYVRGRDSPEGYYRDAFDLEALRTELLDPMGPGGDRMHRTAWFDLEADCPAPSARRRAPADAVLLVDGVFLQRHQLLDAWDLRVYVVAGFDVILRRAKARDAPRFASADAAERRYRTRYLPGQEIYRREVDPESSAHFVVVNDRPAAPRLIEPHAPA